MDTQWQNLLDDPGRRQALFEDLYREMKIIAQSRMAGERSFVTLNATSLVHEAWLRLQKGGNAPWRDRSQFFAAASEAMRRILVEAARRRNAIKRGSGQIPVSLDGIDLPEDVDHQRLLEVNDVLDALEADDPIKAQIGNYSGIQEIRNKFPIGSVAQNSDRPSRDSASHHPSRL